MAADIKDLTRGEYELIRTLVYAKSGISLGDQKMQLVRARSAVVPSPLPLCVLYAAPA